MFNYFLRAQFIEQILWLLGSISELAHKLPDGGIRNLVTLKKMPFNFWLGIMQNMGVFLNIFILNITTFHRICKYVQYSTST